MYTEGQRQVSEGQKEGGVRFSGGEESGGGQSGARQIGKGDDKQGTDHIRTSPTEQHRAVTVGFPIQSPLAVWSNIAETSLSPKWPWEEVHSVACPSVSKWGISLHPQL